MQKIEREKPHFITVLAVRLGAWWALKKEQRRRKMRRGNIPWHNKKQG
jgi:hypothetical protein